MYGTGFVSLTWNLHGINILTLYYKSSLISMTDRNYKHKFQVSFFPLWILWPLNTGKDLIEH